VLILEKIDAKCSAGKAPIGVKIFALNPAKSIVGKIAVAGKRMAMCGGITKNRAACVQVNRP